MIIIDPNFPFSTTQSSFAAQPYGAYLFGAGVLANFGDTEELLNSLDSDTRDYVLKHTQENRSREDILDCVSRLHGEG